MLIYELTYIFLGPRYSKGRSEAERANYQRFVGIDYVYVDQGLGLSHARADLEKKCWVVDP